MKSFLPNWIPILIFTLPIVLFAGYKFNRVIDTRYLFPAFVAFFFSSLLQGLERGNGPFRNSVTRMGCYAIIGLNIYGNAIFSFNEATPELERKVSRVVATPRTLMIPPFVYPKIDPIQRIVDVLERHSRISTVFVCDISWMYGFPFYGNPLEPLQWTGINAAFAVNDLSQRVTLCRGDGSMTDHDLVVFFTTKNREAEIQTLSDNPKRVEEQRGIWQIVDSGNFSGISYSPEFREQIRFFGLDGEISLFRKSK